MEKEKQDNLINKYNPEENIEEYIEKQANTDKKMNYLTLVELKKEKLKIEQNKKNQKEKKEIITEKVNSFFLFLFILFNKIK